MSTPQNHFEKYTRKFSYFLILWEEDGITFAHILE